MGTIGKSSKNQILDSGIQYFCTGFFSSLRIWYSGNSGSSSLENSPLLDPDKDWFPEYWIQYPESGKGTGFQNPDNSGNAGSRIQTSLEILDPEFFSSFYLDPESRIWKRYWIPDSSKKNQFQFYLDPDYGQILDLIWPDKSRFFFQ